MYKKRSFIFSRRIKLSKKRTNLIALFEIFHNSKENLNSFLPFLFYFKLRMQLKNSLMKIYYSLY
jgi:hypothetical protein